VGYNSVADNKSLSSFV